MEKQYNFGDLFTNDEVLAATGGTKSSYTGNWQVIGVESGKLKLVSVSGVGRVRLGKGDSNATGNSDLEKAIDSWKKAVTTLNNAAKINTGISTARSVALADIEKLTTIINKNTDYGKEYTFSSGTFVDKQGNIIKATQENKVKIQDNHIYTTSMNEQTGSLFSGDYWLANPCVFVNGYLARYVCHEVNDGKITRRSMEFVHC